MKLHLYHQYTACSKYYKCLASFLVQGPIQLNRFGHDCVRVCVCTAVDLSLCVHVPLWLVNTMPK